MRVHKTIENLIICYYNSKNITILMYYNVIIINNLTRVAVNYKFYKNYTKKIEKLICLNILNGF
jgi:hypothetical protein